MRKKKALLNQKFLKNLLVDKKINSKVQSDFLLLIGKLLENGFTLSQAIRCLQYVNQKDPLIEKIYRDLQSGIMLSNALIHLQLPPVIQNQLVIAQMNGGLQKTVVQSGLILKEKYRQQSKLKELMAYPLFIIGFLILMMLGMKLYILPQLENASGSSDLDLVVKSFSIGAVLSSVAIFGFVIYVKKLSEYQRAQLLVRIPLIKNCFLNFYQFSILQGWGMQFSNGMDFQSMCSSDQSLSKDSIQYVLSQKYYPI